MNKKNDIEVLIGGVKYTICGYESSEYMVRIASYINDKMEAVKKSVSSGGWIDNDKKNVLLQINIADDYHKEMEKTRELIEEKNITDKALFDLKHELFDANEQIEKLTEQNKKLKDELSDERKKAEERYNEEQKRIEEELLEKTRKLEEELEKSKKLADEAEAEIEKARKHAEEEIANEKKRAEEEIAKEKKKADEAEARYEEQKKKNDELEETIDDLLG